MKSPTVFFRVNMVLLFMRSSVFMHQSGSHLGCTKLGLVPETGRFIRRFSNLLEVTTKKKLIRNDPDKNRPRISVVVLCAAESTGYTGENCNSDPPSRLAYDALVDIMNECAKR